MSVQVSSTTDSKETTQAVMAGVVSAEKVEGNQKSASGSNASQDENSAASETADKDLSEEIQDGVESEDSANEDDSQEDPNDQDKVDKNVAPKKNGFKRRIDKLTKKMSEKEQELEYWKNQALSEKSKNTQTQPQAPKEAKIESQNLRPKAEDYETNEAYIEALTDWKVDQADKKRDQKQKEEAAKADFQKRGQDFQTRITEFKKTASDFDELMEDVHVDVPIHVQEVFFSSEVGPALMYELAKNPSELERISKLSPIKAALEMGKLEAKFLKTPGSKETKTTKAPEPIRPVGAKGGSVKKDINDPTLSQREYEKLREEQIKARNA